MPHLAAGQADKYDRFAMAIRFACPSCQQPIEVDDQWGDESVACPYCRQVVTAPSSSRWPANEIPMASPASPAFTPPPPPTGISTAPTATIASIAHSQASYALTLALGGAILAIVGWFAWLGTQVALAQEKAGSTDPEHIREAYLELVASGQAQTMNATTLLILLVGAICSISGLVLAIRSLLRLQERRGLAIAACIIGVCFLICQILPMLAALTAHQAAQAT